ncbi:MAG: HD-GYP domain-containing protein [Planctomycetes bacterium]|nr:HD-GYP domain-containing protein [Planctomycetota bacterium]
MVDTNNNLSALQLQLLATFGEKVNKLGANFAVSDSNGELLLLNNAGIVETDSQLLTEIAQKILKQNQLKNRNNPDTCVSQFDMDSCILAAALHINEQNVAVALIDLGQKQRSDDNNKNEQLNEMQQKYKPLFTQMLEFLENSFTTLAKAENQTEIACHELSQTYEELTLLYKLSMSMKVTLTDSSFLQMACDNLTEIINVEGIAIIVEKTLNDEKQLVLAAGSGVIDINDDIVAVICDRLQNELNSGKDALIDSDIDSPFKYQWHESIKSIVAVPLYGKEKSKTHPHEEADSKNRLIGFMVAVNRVGKADFDSPDAKLFGSIANSCAVFIENGRLFNELKALFIGSLKALTSSIDAKDQYTRGHSERVAFISRWIAERIAEKHGYDDDFVHKIYLAGLLHDIGKIGIAEDVLCKDGRLTSSEIDYMKMHPSIGANILKEIKQMSQIVPGVLYHHERIDGKGYPNGLVGDQIPLIGKIIGLADSFDAMTSKRTYRKAMTLEQALKEIENGLGKQFDEEIGRIFIESDVHHLWDIMLNGFSQVYDISRVADYGAATIGTLIK